MLDILQLPIVRGIVLKAVMDCIHDLLVAVDKSDVVEKNEAWLHTASILMTAAATLLNLALTNQLGSIDLNVVKDFILMYLGTRAAGTKTLRLGVISVKNKLIGQ